MKCWSSAWQTYTPPPPQCLLKHLGLTQDPLVFGMTSFLQTSSPIPNTCMEKVCQAGFPSLRLNIILTLLGLAQCRLANFSSCREGSEYLFFFFSSLSQDCTRQWPNVVEFSLPSFADDSALCQVRETQRWVSPSPHPQEAYSQGNVVGGGNRGQLPSGLLVAASPYHTLM